MNPIEKLALFTKTEDGIYRSSANNEGGATYDNKAKAYERLVSSKLYNKLMWGTLPVDYIEFSKKAIIDSSGIGLDIGCGGLVQTYQQYGATNNEFILLDNSIEMLKVGQSRLRSNKQRKTDNIHLLQASAFEIPFDDDSFDIVCSFGVLHIFDQKEDFIKEALRVLKPEGMFYFTSLTSDRFISRKYISLLQTQGEFGKPMTSDETRSLFKNSLNLSWYLKGSMLFVSGQKQPHAIPVT